MNNPTDCLVLRVVEKEKDNDIDTILFVIYDIKNEHYIIRGKRKDITNYIFVPYSFECDYAGDIADFIGVVMPGKLSYELYNYDNLPVDPNAITFEFLEDNTSVDYEVVAYDKVKFSYRKIMRFLKILENVYNSF